MKKKIVKDINDEGSARASSSGAAQDNSDKIDEQMMAAPLSQGLGSKSLELFGMSIGSISMGGLGSMDNMISNGMPPGEYSASAYIPCRIHFWWNM